MQDADASIAAVTASVTAVLWKVLCDVILWALSLRR